ncbi:MAG: polysaccharide biosynthesis tyrosine autokinase [Bacteroidaceae bacterium]|nr:polysaccharide biosynthesis tyrosine autokinase [Bacteroidaceae bacterium]
MKQQTQKRGKQLQAENYINIGEILYACLSNWYWFVISIIITLGIAIYRISTTQPTYRRYCEVLIKSKDKAPSIDEQMANMANLGLRSTTNAYNEIYTFKAAETIESVVRRLNLRTNYEKPGTLHPKTLYGEELPITVDFYDIKEEESAALSIDITPEGAFTLHNFQRDGKEIDHAPITGELVDGIALSETPIGKIIIHSTPTFHQLGTTSINVSHTSMQAAIARTSGRLSFGLPDSESDIITIAITDHSIDRADEILNTLVEVYSEDWVKDKNRAADGTLEFINERLAYISDELDEVDNNISSYKSRNRLSSAAENASIQLTKNRNNINELQKLNNDLASMKEILTKLQASKSLNEPLPFGITFSNAMLNNQIAEYNKTVIDRNDAIQKGGENNPEIKNIDMQLAAKRESIIASAKISIKKVETSIAALEKETRKTLAEISKNPEQTKYLASAEREQSVKEKLYLFLLQKREENQLSQAFTAYKTRIITSPTGSTTPTAPVKNRTILMAIAIGLLIPAAIIILRELANTRLRGRKDLNGLSTPIIGEIPQLPVKGKKSNKVPVVVQNGNRNIINEAFRVLRTNIEFMTRDKSQSTIISTSFNPGSGKTFCMINIAVSLAIKGEKVIVIDGDMRHASLSQYISSPKKGMSNYLAGETDNINELIVADQQYPNLHILPVGTIPPNPTELLELPRFATLIEELKTKYRYVLIDCPPIDMVADTHIIEKFADRTFFLVRAGVMERAMVPDIETLYNENKLKNISVILNGVDATGNRYGYKYSYRYGYHRSYHYGYGEKTGN